MGCDRDMYKIRGNRTESQWQRYNKTWWRDNGSHQVNEEVNIFPDVPYEKWPGNAPQWWEPEFCPHCSDCHLKPDCLVYSGKSERTVEQVAKEGVSMKVCLSRKDNVSWKTSSSLYRQHVEAGCRKQAEFNQRILETILYHSTSSYSCDVKGGQKGWWRYK